MVVVFCVCSFSEEIQPPECCSASRFSLLPLPRKSDSAIPGFGTDPCSCLTLSMLPPPGPSHSKPNTRSKVSVWHSSITSTGRAPCQLFSWFHTHQRSISRWISARTCFWVQPGHKYICTSSSLCHWGANGRVCGCCPVTYVWKTSHCLPSCRAIATKSDLVPLYNSKSSFVLPSNGGRKHTRRRGNKTGFTNFCPCSQWFFPR